MAYTVRLEAFEGPLDLLLQLVEAETLDISEISLVRVTEPFVEAIRARAQDERYPLEDLAHFLVIAAKLVALKARLLHEEPTDDVLPAVPSPDRLAELYRGVLRRRERPTPPTRTAILQRLVTLEERIEALRQRIMRGGSFAFSAWVGPEAPREVAVVSFLALLELLKAGTVTVTQPDLFAELTISSV